MATSSIIHHLSYLKGFVAATLMDTDQRKVIEYIHHAEVDISVGDGSLDNAQIVLARLDVIRRKRKHPVDRCLFFRLSDQYHIVRQTRSCRDMCIYLIIDLGRGDLEAARLAVKDLDDRLRF